MLNLLKNLFNMIVKILTLGTIKGNAYLDSKITPLEKLDMTIKRTNEARVKQRHEFFKMSKTFKESEKNLLKAQDELQTLENEIRELMAEGNEQRATQKGRIAVAKIKFIDTLKASVEKSQKRVLDMEFNIEKLKTDIQILETKRSELQMVSAQRDHSKNKALGEVNYDGMDMSIDDLIQSVTTDIDSAITEDSSWVDTDKVFNGDSQTTDADDVSEYLKQFTK